MTEKSALVTEKGTTTIQSSVVSAIANMAATEIEGVDMSHGGSRLPGDNSPTVGEFFDRVTGGGSRTRGVSVEVGQEEAAVDLTVNVLYGKPIAQVTEALRRNVVQRVESLTGLRVTEVNIAVNDVTFPREGSS